MAVATSKRMPALFVGHGNPMNIVRRNRWTEGWSALGAAFPRPKAILMVSAHWYVPATMVTAMPHPRTIHDFGGFPQELYDIKYPAPGAPALAERVRDLLAPIPVGLDQRWGLDHGAWSVLYHLFPDADVPVVQLSIDQTQSPLFHYEIGQRLAPLREEGILLMGSGNLVHNLQAYEWGQPDVGPFDWAARFEEKARGLLLAGEDAQLVNYPAMGPDARLSIPTPDHYPPLLYVLGSRGQDKGVTFPVEGFDGGSMSMLATQVST
jgi:4,5-DOPA dioxygenase extradiol